MKGTLTAGRHTVVPDDIHCFIELEFGSFCSIASGLTIVSGQHPAVGQPEAVSNFPFREHGWGDYPQSKHDGKVTIGSDVWIGQDVTILEGVSVGHGAVLAASAVVVRDVPHYGVVAGNPGELKKFRFGAAAITKLLQLAWWEWPDEKIKRALPLMADIEFFVGSSVKFFDEKT